MGTYAIAIPPIPPPTRNDEPSSSVGILEAIPAHRFPNIWEQIFHNLSKLDDLRNVMNSHEDWRVIMESVHMRSKRKLWLFPKVFPLLCNYLSRDDVLSLREVSSGWSQGVDECIEDRCSHFPSDRRRRFQDIHRRSPPVWSPDDLRFPYRISGFNFPLDVDDFIEGMESHPRNPIIGRGLVILAHIQPLETVARANRFIPLFGHHLTNLKIQLLETAEINWSGMNGSAFIGSLLPHTPNLRQLEITRLDHNCPDPSGQMGDIQVPPVIDSLRTLQLNYKDSRYLLPEKDRNRPPREFMEAPALIRAYAPQLTSFGVDGVSDVHWTALDWPNLQEFHAQVGREDCTILNSLLNLKAPQLSRLDITTYFTSCKQLQELFQVMRRFPKLEPSGVTIISRY